MCGITGIFNYKTNHNVSDDIIKKMSKLLIHRGPDENSVFINKHIAFGFTRLSIIDLENGSQPIHSSCGRFTLIFNGEIYNYKELRDELIRKGYYFKTNSDSEVLLALIESNYENFEKRLCGMFAFAVFDKKLNKLSLVRDRLGKKPLFWMETINGIAFSSEIKSLFVLNSKKIKPNWESLSNFLSLGYCPGPNTAFENIHHVQPGSRIIVDNKIIASSWWSLPSLPEQHKIASVDWESKILEKLKKSVHYRLVSDVPLGLFLSGGLDSALILAIIKEYGVPNGFKTYTASFKNASFDEAENASFIANHFGVKNVTIPISPHDIPPIFEDVVYKSDNLIANPAIFANYILSKIASEDVKVALNGGGGDELFFGYETYKADFLSEFFTYIPRPVINLFKESLNLLPTSHKKLNFKYKTKKFLDGLHLPPLERHYSWRTIISETEKENLLNNYLKNFNSYSSYEDAYKEFEGDDFYEQVAFADMKVWWQGMGLYQGDTMSMANSLELRMPFMDHDLVETVYSIPRHLKFRSGNLKSFFRKICYNYLPKNVINKPKSGFHLPLAEWFSEELEPFVREKLSTERLNCVEGLNKNKVNQILDDHINLKEDNSFKICNLLILVEWYIQFCT